MTLNEFNEQERNRWRLSFLKVIVYTTAILFTILIAIRFSSDWQFRLTDLILFVLITVFIFLYILAKRGFLIQASAAMIIFSLLAVLYLTYAGKGIYDSAAFGFVAVMIASYLLLGWRFSAFVVLISFSWLWFLAWLELSGHRTFQTLDSVVNYTRDITFILLIVTALSHFYLQRIDNYIRRLSNELVEREKAKATLIVKEENYRYLFEEASEGILIGNTDGDMILCNARLLKITGYKMEDLIGKNLTALFSEEQLREEPLRYDLLEENQTVTRTRSITKKDGTAVPIEMRTKKLNDGRYQSFITDISKRIQAEKSLRDFERIFNLSANPICLVDNSGTLVKVNPIFIKILGYSEKELIGKQVTNFLHSDDVDATELYVQKMIKKKAEIISYENRYLTKKGKTIWFSWITQPIYSEDMSFSIAHDITHLKNIENELLKAKERAEESDQLKTAFLENMSHEIRTPMNGILGFSEMLDNENIQSKERSHYVNIIINSGQKLLSIVDDILDISAIETGQIELSIEKVNITELMTDVYDFFYPKVKSSGLNFSLKHPSGSDIITSTDKTRLHQILNNLVSNSIKFTPSGTISLLYKKVDGHIVFSVQDTGIGIEADMQKVIFERFRRVEAKFGTDLGGTGLGLSISQSLVELLGGTIQVDSDPDKGSTFTFTIPHESGDENDVTDSGWSKSELNPHQKGRCILIAEDDDINFQYLDEVLKNVGYNIKHALTGVEAVKMAVSDSDIDLVLMDIKMPEMDGYMATKEIKKTKPDLPIIAQTAYAMTKDKEKAQEAGCDDYLSKPILKEDLLKLLNHYLNTDIE